MKKGKIKFLTLNEFASSVGLNHLEKELVRQKNRIIDYLKKVRLQKQLSQVVLAHKVGTKQPAIARMEAGQVGEVSFDFLIRVAVALNISLELVPIKRAA